MLKRAFVFADEQDECRAITINEDYLLRTRHQQWVTRLIIEEIDRQIYYYTKYMGQPGSLVINNYWFDKVRYTQDTKQIDNKYYYKKLYVVIVKNENVLSVQGKIETPDIIDQMLKIDKVENECWEEYESQIEVE